MLDVTVKTLDGQNRSFSVPDDTTVKQFKERIASSINVTAETQRLIFQGRVLQDDKLLKDYDVQGKVVHVVMRAPPVAGRPSNDAAPSSTTGGARDPNSVVVGSFTLPAEILDANMVQNIAQDAIRSMGNLGRNARVSTRTSEISQKMYGLISVAVLILQLQPDGSSFDPDGSSVDVHIHLGPVQTGQATSEAQMRLNTARQMMRLANEALTQFENPDGDGESEATPAPSAPPRDQREEENTDGTSAPSPMDTSETTAEQTSTSTTAEAQTGGQDSPASSSSRGATPDSQSDQGTQPNAQRGPVQPNISALGEVLGEAQELSTRLQPHLRRFQEIVQEDGDWNQEEQQSNQRVCNVVSEVMHSVSHCFHALSDLMVDLSQPRPRQLYVTLAIAHPHTTVIQQTIPVQVAIPTMGQASASVSTASTGTSTPRPATAEAGTQPAASTTSTGTAGVQVNAGLSDDELRRITEMTEEMASGLQNVIGQGLQQGDGSRDNPYVFVEMRPDSVTVNSISAEVVTTSEPSSNSSTNREGASSTTADTTGSGRPQPSQAQPQPQPQPQPNAQPAGAANALPPNMINDILQQILRPPGVGAGVQPQRMQIHVGQQRPPGSATFIGGPGMTFQPLMMRATVPMSESGTQTAGGARPANSATQTSTPTSTFGTQTSGSTTTPSNTSGTQTPGMPRATAFVMPGMPGMPGPGGHSHGRGVNPVDPYLQCSSRHFLTQHARSIINQAAPANDTALADMVGNLMSGFIGAAQGQRVPGPRPNQPPRMGSNAPQGSAPGSAPGQGTTPAAGSQPMPGAGIQLGGLPTFFPGRMPLIPGMTMRMAMPRPAPPGAPRATAQAGGQAPAGGFRPAGTTPTSQASASTGTSSTTDSAGGGEPQFVQMLRSMLQSANSATAAMAGQPGAAPATTTTDQNQNIQPPGQGIGGVGAGGRGSQAISDEAFTQLVSGITGFMTQAAMGQAPQQTITDFLSTLGEDYNLPMGEGFINEGLSCVLAHLQITDLIQVFYGQAQALNQVQGPLRGFVLTRVLDGAPPFRDNIRTSVGRLVDQMEPEILEAVNSVTVRPNVDFHGTLLRFFNQQFNNVISLIINARDGDPNFGQDLYACIRRLLSELFVLCSRCLGGMQAVQQMVSQRLQSFTTGINPLVQQWMNSMTSRQLGTFIPTITVSESEVSFYVVYKDQATQPAAPKPSTSTTTGASSTAPVSKPATKDAAKKTTVSPLEKVRKRSPSPKRAPAVAGKDSEKVTSSGQPMDMSPSSASEGSPEAQELPRPVRGAEGGARPREATRNGLPQSPTVNGGDWTAVVPQDWVPVIAQDIERQQNQNAQAPFSDVYLQGMPPKRRKMMTDDRPTSLSNMSEALPDSVRRAVNAAAVEPISSIDNLTSEAVNDADLHQSYDSEINSTLACRLNSDSDYRSERFPNSEEYYHKTDGEKK